MINTNTYRLCADIRRQTDNQILSLPISANRKVRDEIFSNVENLVRDNIFNPTWNNIRTILKP